MKTKMRESRLIVAKIGDLPIPPSPPPPPGISSEKDTVCVLWIRRLFVKNLPAPVMHDCNAWRQTRESRHGRGNWTHVHHKKILQTQENLLRGMIHCLRLTNVHCSCIAWSPSCSVSALHLGLLTSPALVMQYSLHCMAVPSACWREDEDHRYTKAPDFLHQIFYSNLLFRMRIGSGFTSFFVF